MFEVSENSQVVQATQPATAAPTPRAPSSYDAITAKLIDRIEAGFSMQVSPATELARLRNLSYLSRQVQAHFGLGVNAAADAVASSETVAELVARIAELKGITPAQPDLFGIPASQGDAIVGAAGERRND